MQVKLPGREVRTDKLPASRMLFMSLWLGMHSTATVGFLPACHFSRLRQWVQKQRQKAAKFLQSW